MTTASEPQSEFLLKASVLLFLFRAMAGARTAARRDEVSQQLLALLREFLSFESGAIILGRTEEELTHQCDDPDLWSHLRDNGPFTSKDATAVPIYTKGELVGALILRGANGGILDALSAVASIASVSIESIREVERLRDHCAALEHLLCGRGGILGNSPAILRLLHHIEKLAPRDTTVLIQGESGTGKELVARLLHRGSPRAEAPFVAINCAAIAESLLESELFGYEKGAFTGAGTQKKGKIESAQGGTLFLDEIGEMPLALQPKLLRVLQERELERIGATKPVKVDIRVVAATNRDLAQQVRDGTFRLDLLHRLNVVTLRTPPLRERKEDIPLLSEHFLRTFGEQCGRPSLSMSDSALHCLQSYEWPGNIRELANAIEHAVVLSETAVLLPTDLPEVLCDAVPAGDLSPFHASVSDAKRESIIRAYQQGGDYKGAAKILGLHPTYLLRLVKNLGLKDAVKK